MIFPVPGSKHLEDKAIHSIKEAQFKSMSYFVVTHYSKGTTFEFVHREKMFTGLWTYVVALGGT